LCLGKNGNGAPASLASAANLVFSEDKKTPTATSGNDFQKTPKPPDEQSFASSNPPLASKSQTNSIVNVPVYKTDDNAQKSRPQSMMTPGLSSNQFPSLNPSKKKMNLNFVERDMEGSGGAWSVLSKPIPPPGFSQNEKKKTPPPGKRNYLAFLFKNIS